MSDKYLEVKSNDTLETTCGQNETSEANVTNAPKVLSSENSEQPSSVNAGQLVAEAQSNGESRELSTAKDLIKTERGEIQSSEAVVGNSARESVHNESAEQNINQSDVRAVVNNTTRALKVSTDNKGTKYIHAAAENAGFERSTSEKKTITNMILVKEVKKLIKEFGGSGGASGDTYTKSQIDAFLNEKENISNKVLILSNTSTNTQYPSAKVVYDNLVNVREVAEGKCKAFVIDAQSDITGTKDANDEYTGVTAITGVDLTKLKIGDVILIKELNVPDYWVSNLVYESEVLTSVSLNKLETSKVDLTNYADLTSAQTITGLKTFIDSIELSNGNSSDRHILLKQDSNGYFDIDLQNNGRGYIGNISSFRPRTDNVADVGSQYVYWRDIYFKGKLKSATNSVGLDEIATTNTDQTITGTKTFSQINFDSNMWIAKIGSGLAVRVESGRYPFIFYSDVTNVGRNLIPSYDDEIDIGSTSNRVKDICLSGKIKDGTNEVAIGNLIPKVIKLDTGVYTSGTAMSQTDYDQLSFLLNLKFEEVANLNLKFIRIDTNRNECHSTTNVRVRAAGTTLDSNAAWFDITIDFGIGSAITLTPTRLTNQQY